ncbi:MAG: glycosyltransferase family 4 protein, partial [Anaerolineae bacterium]
VADEKVMTAVLRKYGITPPYLLFVSTLQPRKNLIRLIEAFTQAQTSHQLVLAGKVGWLAQPILDAVADHQRLLPSGAPAIVLPGFVDDDDKAALISGATAVLYPSLYEGFGFPVLEAQACGAPVLCANTSSLPEVAGEAALLVDPLDTAAIRDGIHRLVRDPLLRAELVEAGLENVKRFTWEETAVRILDVLEEAGK